MQLRLRSKSFNGRTAIRFAYRCGILLVRSGGACRKREREREGGPPFFYRPRTIYGHDASILQKRSRVRSHVRCHESTIVSKQSQVETRSRQQSDANERRSTAVHSASEQGKTRERKRERTNERSFFFYLSATLVIGLCLAPRSTSLPARITSYVGRRCR